MLKTHIAELGAGAGDASRFRIECDFGDHQGAYKSAEEAQPVGFNGSTARNAFALGAGLIVAQREG